jgi:hypothetical protein
LHKLVLVQPDKCADADYLPVALKSAQLSIERLRSGSEAPSAMGELVDRMDLGREGIKLSLKLPLRVAEAGGCSMLAKIIRASQPRKLRFRLFLNLVTYKPCAVRRGTGSILDRENRINC